MKKVDKLGTKTANRDESGRFPQGVSGNPSGRPKSQFGDFIRESTLDGKELVDAVLEVFREARKEKDSEIVLQSATWLADRGWGKPSQEIQGTFNVNTIIDEINKRFE